MNHRRQLAQRVALGFTPLAWGPSAPIFGDREGPGFLGWEQFDASKVIPPMTDQTAIHYVRNRIVERFLERSERYLLFVDQDMMLPADVLVHVGAYEQPVISGTYFKRDHEKPEPIAYHWLDEERYKLRHVGPDELPRWLLEDPGLHQVDVVGAGCLAIHRDVLQAIGADWFTGAIGAEDVNFCRRAQDLGFPVYLDTELVCRHLDPAFPIGANWYLSWVASRARSGLL